MPIPNGGLITETNRQYYAGSQGFTGNGSQLVFTTTFNTDLIFGNANPTSIDYALNNFKLYSSFSGAPSSFTEIISGYSVSGNAITFTGAPVNGQAIVVQLKMLDGGQYGTQQAFGNTVENNYGGYAYTSLDDIINNFIVAYVGPGKIVSDVKVTDVLFHAKRGLQEFSYDTLKSIKSQELTVPHSLSIVLPQDYVSHVKVCRIDEAGVKHIIYPADRLTINPYENPVQDTQGVPIQDNFDDNIEGTSLTEERWRTSGENLALLSLLNNGYEYDMYGGNGRGRSGRYGLDPQIAQTNGWFTINDREGKMSFSSHFADHLIVLEYISDGLAYDRDTRVPKMAEEAIYAHILHAIVSTRTNQPEYLVQRLKQERFAKLRNTKIRLSGIKLEEITQVFRGQSKWIKH